MGWTGVAALGALIATLGLPFGRPALAQPLEGPRLDEHTAFTVEGGRVKLGLLGFEYGITDGLSVGTDPPAWAAGAYTRSWVPNLHVKYTFLAEDRFRVSGQLGGYFVDLTSAQAARGKLVVVPVTALASVGLAPAWWGHLEGSYTFLQARGAGDANRAEVGGALSTEAVQIGAMLEYRPKPRLALTLRGRSQVWMRPLVLEGETQIDPYTRADLQAELQPRHEHPYAVVASVTYLWRHLHARIGAGYGSIFVTGANVYLPYRGFVPDGSLSLIF